MQFMFSKFSQILSIFSDQHIHVLELLFNVLQLFLIISLTVYWIILIRLLFDMWRSKHFKQN